MDNNKFRDLVLSEALPVMVATASRVAIGRNAQTKSTAAAKDWLKTKTQSTIKTSAVKHTPSKPKTSETKADDTTPNKPVSKPETTENKPTTSGNPLPDNTPKHNDDDTSSSSTKDNKIRVAIKDKLAQARKTTATSSKGIVSGAIKGTLKQLGSSSVN